MERADVLQQIVWVKYKAILVFSSHMKSATIDRS
jgi:hypothetical protein